MAVVSRQNSRRQQKTLTDAFKDVLVSLPDTFVRDHDAVINGALFLLTSRAQAAIREKNTETDLGITDVINKQFQSLDRDNQASLSTALNQVWDKRRPQRAPQEPQVDTSPTRSVEVLREAFNLS